MSFEHAKEMWSNKLSSQMTPKNPFDIKRDNWPH